MVSDGGDAWTHDQGMNHHHLCGYGTFQIARVKSRDIEVKVQELVSDGGFVETYS